MAGIADRVGTGRRRCAPAACFDHNRPMSQRTQLVSDMYAAFERRDVAAVLRGLDADITLAQTSMLPWGGTYRGTAGAASFFQKITTSVDTKIIAEELIEAGETVVAVARTRGRVRSNDVRFDVRAVHVWTIRDGKVAAIEFYTDTPALLAAMEQAPTGD